MTIRKFAQDTSDPSTMTAADRRRVVSWLLSHIDATAGNPEPNRRYLQAAHIAGQTLFAAHATVHLHMLRQAWRDPRSAIRDPREVSGQLLRLALIPLGHATGRLQIGNSGRSDVRAFSAMALRPEIATLLSQPTRHVLPASRQHRTP